VARMLLAVASVSLGRGGIYAPHAGDIGIPRERQNRECCRSTELAIVVSRRALGAQPIQVLNLVLKRGMRLMLTGIGIGLFASYFLTHLLASQIWGASPQQILPPSQPWSHLPSSSEY
jgi:hypothetical protein